MAVLWRKIKLKTMGQLSKDEFPVLDALITVHYDNIDQNHFVRTQIESRIIEYQIQGYTVYNLSTFQHPPARENVQQISSPSEDAWLDYDLGSQIEQLVSLLKESHKKILFQDIEIVGVTWWKCVEQARNLLVQYNVPAHINYDYTDLVVDYIGIKELGITVLMDGEPIPIPSDYVLERYRKSIERVK